MAPVAKIQRRGWKSGVWQVKLQDVKRNCILVPVCIWPLALTHRIAISLFGATSPAPRGRGCAASSTSHQFISRALVFLVHISASPVVPSAPLTLCPDAGVAEPSLASSSFHPGLSPSNPRSQSCHPSAPPNELKEVCF